MLAFDLEGSFDLRSNIVNICKRDRIRCIFRVSVNKFKQSEKIEDHIIYVAKNVNEARSFKVPFHILEAGRNVEEVLKVKEFCAKKSSIRFIIEFDFNLLRLYDGFHFANYLKSLAILMNICRRRQITTIFSSAARSPNELVPPRVLYSFYKLLGGKMARREVLSEIPYKELLEKLDLGPKIVGG